MRFPTTRIELQDELNALAGPAAGPNGGADLH